MLPSQSRTKDLPRRWSPINHLLPYGIRGVDRGEPEVKLESRPDQVILNKPDLSEGALKRRFPARDQPTRNPLKRIHLEHRAGTEPAAPSINVAFSNPFASSRPRSMIPLHAAMPSHVRRIVDVEPILQARSRSRQTPPLDGPNQVETDNIPYLASDIVDQPLSTPPESKMVTLRSGKKLPRALVEDWSSSSSDVGAIEGSRLRDFEQLRRNAYNPRRRAVYAHNQMPQKARDLDPQANLSAPKRFPSSEPVDCKPKFAKGKRRVKQDGYSMTRKHKSLHETIVD